MDIIESIKIGPFRLYRRPDGRLVAKHDKMTDELPVSEDQLARWLLRAAREALTFDAA